MQIFENIIRKSKNNKKYFILLSFMMALIIFYKGAKYTEGYKFRQNQEVQQALKYFVYAEYRRFKQDNIYCNNREPKYACEVKNNSKNLLLVGNSFTGVFVNIISEQNINSLFFYYEQCPLLLEGVWFGSVPECSKVNKKRWLEIEK